MVLFADKDEFGRDVVGAAFLLRLDAVSGWPRVSLLSRLAVQWRKALVLAQARSPESGERAAHRPMTKVVHAPHGSVSLLERAD